MDNSFFPFTIFGLNSAVIISSLTAALIGFLPRLLIALIIFFIGRWIANNFARAVEKILEAIHLRQVVASFQLGIHLAKETESSLIRVLGILTRYAVLYGAAIIILQILGLNPVADFLIRIVDIVPRLLSSLLIIVIGIIVAGFVESLVKRAMLVLDPATARLSGKVGGYVVVSFFALMALAELGLAATFVNTLFIGLVATVVIAVGLAIGLGAKDLVSQVLLEWYQKRSLPPKK